MTPQKYLQIILGFSLVIQAGCSRFMISSHEQSQLTDHIEYLASDALAGRYPGTTGDSLAAFYIRDQFERIGLELLADNGLQTFDVVTDLEFGDNNNLSINGNQKILIDDYVPMSFSSNQSFSGEVVFCGYGFDFEMHGQRINNYDGVDVSGMWVLLLRGGPDGNNPHGPYGKFISDRNKVTTAKDHGAGGVLLVSGSQFNPDDKLANLKSDGTLSRSGIPVIQISRNIADHILQTKNVNLDDLEAQIISGTQEFKPIMIDQNIYARTNIIEIKQSTFNILAKIDGGDPLLKNESIVIGAHYDHLGMGGRHSGSRRPHQNEIHNGADDNASGVAGMLRLAGQFQKHGPPKRSIIFAAFGAEEMGLIGSKFLMSSKLIDHDQIQLMINMDMIGRLNDQNGLAIGGSGTALNLETTLDSLLNLTTLNHTFKPEGFGPSDHSSFYVNDIPVVFFFTGAHDDYHTPDDDPEKINYDGIIQITNAIYSIVDYYSQLDKKLVFQEAGPKESKARSSFKVTLGIMPDYIYSGKGLRVDAVKEEGPARNSGILKGDIIIEMDEKSVDDIYEYMKRLNEIDPGEIIPVMVLREEKKLLIDVQF